MIVFTPKEIYKVFSEALPNLLSIITILSTKNYYSKEEYCDENFPKMLNTLLIYSTILFFKSIVYALLVMNNVHSKAGTKCLFAFADLIIYM